MEVLVKKEKKLKHYSCLLSHCCEEDQRRAFCVSFILNHFTAEYGKRLVHC